MRNGRNRGWFWFLFFVVFFGFGGSSLLPFFIIIAVVAAIAIASVHSAKKQDESRSYQRGYQRASEYRRAGATMSSSQLAKINVYLRRWYRSHDRLNVGTNVSLRIHGSTYASLSSLDVYRGEEMICSLNDFERRYPDSYKEIIDELSRLSSSPQDTEVFDAEVTPSRPAEQAQPAAKGAAYFIDEINSLNNDIPDEDITNGLYETASLLGQIQKLEEKFPKSKDKLKKLYEYYLPILTRILKQYSALQNAKMDPNYEDTYNKLKRTINLINDAMKTIISSMTDADMMNLSADLSTLEAVLQKDGLTSEGQMKTKNGE